MKKLLILSLLIACSKEVNTTAQIPLPIGGGYNFDTTIDKDVEEGEDVEQADTISIIEDVSDIVEEDIQQQETTDTATTQQDKIGRAHV